jgi:hypothetical protein
MRSSKRLSIWLLTLRLEKRYVGIE